MSRSGQQRGVKRKEQTSEASGSSNPQPGKSTLYEAESDPSIEDMVHALNGRLRQAAGQHAKASSNQSIYEDVQAGMKTDKNVVGERQVEEFKKLDRLYEEVVKERQERQEIFGVPKYSQIVAAAAEMYNAQSSGTTKKAPKHRPLCCIVM